MEKVKVAIDGKNTAPVEANLVSKTDQMLVIYFTAADLKATLMWQRDQYVGTIAGMSLASDGKIIK
jgi:hypothetical protein